ALLLLPAALDLLLPGAQRLHEEGAADHRHSHGRVRTCPVHFVSTPFSALRPMFPRLTLSRLPTYFFITIFTLMVLWWVELYHRSSAKKGFLGRMKWVFVAINVVLYVFLIIVIIIYAVTEGSRVRSSSLISFS